MSHINDRRYRVGADGIREPSGYSGGRPWRVRYRSPSGQERSKSFPSAREAKQFAAEVTIDVATGDWVDPRHGKVTCGDWIDKWTGTRQGLRASTLDRDNSHLRNHIVPRWRSVPIARVEYIDVQQWIADLVASGLAPETIRRIVQLFAQAMREAVKAGKLASTPCEGLSLPSIDKPC